MRRALTLRRLTLLGLTLAALPAAAQAPDTKEPPLRRAAAEVANRGLGAPPATLHLATPRDAVSSFLGLADRGHDREAAHALDLSAVPSESQASEGQRLARRLAIVLHRVHPAGFGRMSGDALGAPERDVPFDEEIVARAPMDGGEVQLRLTRYPSRSQPVWLFSAATVADIDELYDRHGYGWAGDHLPRIFLRWTLWEVQLWQWAGLVLGLAAALLLGYLASFLFRRVFLGLTSRTRWGWDDALVRGTRAPITVALAVLAFVVVLPLLSIAPGPYGVLLGLCKLLAILAVGWVLVRVIDVLAGVVLRTFQERQDALGTAMVPVARKLLKPIIVIIVLVVAAQNMGLNVGGLLAGLGIGGLALALAGKSALENLLGSIIIAFDRPFKIGDYVKVGDLGGNVEDVGLRSTRLRTPDRTLVTIPNAQMADAKVENFGARDRMRLLTMLELQHDTSADQLRLIIDETKRYLLAHPRVWQEGFGVRLVGLGPGALQLEVSCYIETTDFGQLTAVKESVLFDLRDLVERAGARLARPSQTVYVGKESAADPERATAAMATVEQRRAAGELCLPEIPEAVRQAIRPPAPRTAE